MAANKSKAKNQSSSKQDNGKKETPMSRNDQGSVSWTVTIAIALIAAFSSYHLTLKYLPRFLQPSDESANVQEFAKTISEVKDPVPCGASNFIAEVRVPGLHLVSVVFTSLRRTPVFFCSYFYSRVLYRFVSKVMAAVHKTHLTAMRMS
jgi:hypothetical protein